MIPENVQQLLDRFARTPDGQEFYRYLLTVVCQTIPAGTDGALRQQEGTRIFARDLMTQMGEGIDASVRRDGNHQPVILQRNGGNDQPRRRQSVREYIAGQPSWYDDQSGDEPAAGAGTS